MVLGPLLCVFAFFSALVMDRDCPLLFKALILILAFGTLTVLLPLSRTLGMISFFTLLGISRSGMIPFSHFGDLADNSRSWMELMRWIIGTACVGFFSLYLMEWIYFLEPLSPLGAVVAVSLAGAFLMSTWESFMRRPSLQTTHSDIDIKSLGTVYQDLALRQEKLEKRLLPSLGKEKDLMEAATRILFHNHSLMKHGNELFEFLRSKKIRFLSNGDLDFPGEYSLSESEKNSEKEKQLVFWKERMKTLGSEERKIHETVETNLLKLENLESFLISQMSEQLHSTQSELENLSREAFERLELNEERRKILEELEDSL